MHDRLARLERQVQVRAWLRRSGGRVRESLPAALQIAAAAVAAYVIAHYVLGHVSPLIAVTATITTLGLARDARPRRVLENALGVTVGITFAAVLSSLLGHGWWQLAIVILGTLLVARALSPSPSFAIAATVQSTLVVLLPVPAGGPFERSLDAVIAGVVAMAATALIPRDPRRATNRDARIVFSVVREAMESLTDALQHGARSAAELSLDRLRRSQGLLDNWMASLDSAVAIARFSPWLQKSRPELARQQRLQPAIDLLTRHLRAIARRAMVMTASGEEHPSLAHVMSELTDAVGALAESVIEPGAETTARIALSKVAAQLDPTAMSPAGVLHDSVLVMQLRPLVVDLLVATGMPDDEARALLPKV